MKSLGRKIFDILLSLFLLGLGLFTFVAAFVALIHDDFDTKEKLIVFFVMSAIAGASLQKAVSLLYYLNVSDEERAMRHDGKYFLLGLLAGLLWNNCDK